MSPDFWQFQILFFIYTHHSMAEISRELGLIHFDLLPTFI